MFVHLVPLSLVPLRGCLVTCRGVPAIQAVKLSTLPHDSAIRAIPQGSPSSRGKRQPRSAGGTCLGCQRRPMNASMLLNSSSRSSLEALTLMIEGEGLCSCPIIPHSHYERP